MLHNPATVGLDLDAPGTFTIHQKILAKNKFLRKIYLEWYHFIWEQMPDLEGHILEVGTGAGFLKQSLPETITSDVILHSNIDLVLDGRRLPVRRGSLKAIVMVDVLHHILNAPDFFKAARRSVMKGGVIVMVEPWNSTWANFIYNRFHHEPFLTQEEVWGSQDSHSSSQTNGAIPWILFQRDLSRFSLEFPEWEVKSVQPCLPFRYLLSGGLSMRQLVPTWSFSFWRWIEQVMQPVMERWAMFARIVLIKKN